MGGGLTRFQDSVRLLHDWETIPVKERFNIKNQFSFKRVSNANSTVIASIDY